jgi:hypothetical protein
MTKRHQSLKIRKQRIEAELFDEAKAMQDERGHQDDALSHIVATFFCALIGAFAGMGLVVWLMMFLK